MSIVRQKQYRYLTGLFLLAFLVKALVPAGFMPAVGKNGKTEIVICTSQGLETKLVDGDQQPFSGDHDEEQNHPPCPYAPLVAQNITDQAPAWSFSIITSDLVFDTPHVSQPYGIVIKPWMAQGPPANLLT